MPYLRFGTLSTPIGGAPPTALLNRYLGPHERIESIASTIPNRAESSIARGDTTDDYFRLRLLELDLTNCFEPSQLDALKPGDGLFELWQQVLGAGGYPKVKEDSIDAERLLRRKFGYIAFA